MKITTEHYKILEVGLEQATSLLKTFHGSDDVFASVYQAKGFSSTRYNWDLLWIAQKQKFLPEYFIQDVLYQYLNDSHINTAISKITGVK